MDDATVAEHVDRIAELGYTIVPDAIEPDLLDAVADDLLRLEHDLGAVPAANSFEGHHTVRIYNLQAQPIHADDQLVPLPKPHVPVVCNTMWALTDFTEANGATRLVPGTHLSPSNPDYGSPYDSVPAEMARGSVLVWHGSLWHGGGANTTDTRRTGIAMNYCAGWIRQQENQQLGLDPALVRTFEPRLRRLVGYGIYNGLMGHIDKHDPDELLGVGAGADGRMVWDAIG